MRQWLKDGNDWLDGTGKYSYRFFITQSVGHAHEHAMRTSKQESKSAARSDMLRIVANFIASASRYAEKARTEVRNHKLRIAEKDMQRVIKELGKAQHPIADDTSPQHFDFQVWRGLWYLGEAWDHHKAENEDEYNKLQTDPAAHLVNYGHIDDALRNTLSE